MNKLVRVISFVANTELQNETPVHKDMQNFTSLMNLVIQFMKLEFNFMGFTFSYWQVLILVCLGSIIGWFVKSVFSS